MQCKICQNATTPWAHPMLAKTYFHCASCELITLEDSFIVTLAREKSQYENHVNTLENAGYVKMFEDFIDIFGEIFTCKKVNALDFGSGPTPVLAQLLERRGANVDCYDKFYQPSRVFEGKKYDLITSTEVFEHLQNPLETLSLLAKHLNPNGLIAIMTLFHPNDQALFFQWWYPRDPTHITFFTCKTLEILAEKCGLSMVTNDGRRVVVLKKG